MKKTILFLLCLCLLFTSSCSWFQKDDSSLGNTFTVYRIDKNPDTNSLIQTETCLLPATSRTNIDTIIPLFMSQDTAEYSCAVPSEVSLESYSLEDGLVTLYFSSEFLTLSSIDQSISASCAALTLCQLEDVDAITIYGGNELIFQAMTDEDVLMQDSESDPYTHRLRLYFTDSTGTWLTSEYHSLSLDENASLERYVLEELLRGPNSDSLQSAIPYGTQLLSCSTENGLCTVNLSSEFISEKPTDSTKERLAIWSIVNSLTVLSDVDSVLLLCDGQSIEHYVYRTLTDPLPSNKAAIGPPSVAKGESEVSLVFALSDLSSYISVPYGIYMDGYDSKTEAVLAALSSAEEPGLSNFVLGKDIASTISSTGNICNIELSESSLISLNSDEKLAAVKCIAGTILSLGEFRAVRFFLNGQEADFDGNNYSGPWTINDINFVS